MTPLADGTWRQRLSIGGKQRWVHFPITSRRDAERAAKALRPLARAGADLATVQAVANEIADRERFERELRRALAIALGQRRERSRATPTFREVADRWTSGELAREHPDHIRIKNARDDRSRLREICAVPFERGTVGDVPIGDFNLAHAKAVMGALPPTVRSKLTRRAYAQLILRVLNLAVFPLEIITTNPIPKGWLPKARATKAKSWIGPDEERALLGCVAIPLERRIGYALAAREGLRHGELARLRWSDLDLERGTLRLDVNKTAEPRQWALDPSVRRALAIWRTIHPSDPVIPCGPDYDAADDFRADLRAAGIDRAELFASTEQRMAIRFHDLRTSFVTVALAIGRSETWVSDRTGHRSTAMIARYRQAARTAAEIGIGWFEPMHLAIPELRDLDLKLDPPLLRAVAP